MSPLAPLISLLPSFAQSHNTTFISTISPTTFDPPFYFTTRSSVFTWVSDKYLSLAAPVVVYWVLSFLFHLLDTAKIDYFERRRIHESPEVLARNRATFTEVLKAVVVQHVIQVALGYLWLADDEASLKIQMMRDYLGEMREIAPRVADLVFLVVGPKAGADLLVKYGPAIVQWTYWWGIPTAQMFFAFFLIDTWQYFMHRLFHTSRFLYRHFHSWHHRLYVPFAFGALYNHPVEGIVLDTAGAGIAEALAGMTVRQATLLFVISTFKTVDDHCGYKLWWDPCQMFFANNSDYHDIHHQAYGIKANFSQPFFTNWDWLLNTQMTRTQANNRVKRPVPREDDSLPARDLASKAQ